MLHRPSWPPDATMPSNSRRTGIANSKPAYPHDALFSNIFLLLRSQFLSVNSPAPELTAKFRVKVRVTIRVRVRFRVMVSVSVSVDDNNSGSGELADKCRVLLPGG